MMLDEKLQRFLAGPVMQVLCVGDADGRPVIGRGCGLLVESSDVIELVLSQWQWPRVAPLIGDGCNVAVTFMLPATYECYQVKGTATLAAVTDRHIDAARGYVAQTFVSLQSLGLPRPVDDAYFTYADAAVVRIKVDNIYMQTPGANAGQTREQ